jgi:hypothetical protein
MHTCVGRRVMMTSATWTDAETVVIMTPVVTRITDMICVKVYLAANEINIMIQLKNVLRLFEGLKLQRMCGGDNWSLKNLTYLLFDTNHPMNKLTTSPPHLKY